MSLEQLWREYQAHGTVMTNIVEDAQDAFYLALLAFGNQDVWLAREYAQQAVKQVPENLVFVQAERYLHHVLQAGKQQVYVSAEGFQYFIRGGGNVPLYEQVSAALHSAYQEYASLRLLDIGVGDGRALLPALTDTIQHLDVVEPSETMLAATCCALDNRDIAYHAACAPVQNFIHERNERWDIIQATFSLQSLPADERPTVLTWMRKHGKRVLLVEFDPPDFTDMFAPERVRYILSRYAQGLQEYVESAHYHEVAQDFLMPVMFGYFDLTTARTNYEQPVQSWTVALRDAGFTQIQTRMLYPYWWAAAYLIDAY